MTRRLPEPRKRARAALTAKAQRAFLELVSEGWSTTAAAEQTGHARQRFYEAKDRDPDFAEAWEEASEAGRDWVEDELRTAATEGWRERDAVYEEGKMVRETIRERRDPRLLARLASKRQPEQSSEGPAVVVFLSAFGDIAPRPADLEVDGSEVRELPGASA